MTETYLNLVGILLFYVTWTVLSKIAERLRSINFWINLIISCALKFQNRNIKQFRHLSTRHRPFIDWKPLLTIYQIHLQRAKTLFDRHGSIVLQTILKFKDENTYVFLKQELANTNIYNKFDIGFRHAVCNFIYRNNRAQMFIGFDRENSSAAEKKDYEDFAFIVLLVV